MRAPAHRRAVVLMVIAPTLWSIAGVVTRHLSPELQANGRFEITFWRSFFAALTVAGFLLFVRRDFVGSIRRAGAPGLLSGRDVGDDVRLLHAGADADVDRQHADRPRRRAADDRIPRVGDRCARPIAPRTWLAIGIAMAGIVWMFAGSLRIESPASVLGMLIAFGAPVASAVNVVILKKRGHVGRPRARGVSRGDALGAC